MEGAGSAGRGAELGMCAFVRGELKKERGRTNDLCYAIVWMVYSWIKRCFYTDGNVPI